MSDSDFYDFIAAVISGGLGNSWPVKYVFSCLADLSKVLPYQQLLVHDRSYRKRFGHKKELL